MSWGPGTEVCVASVPSTQNRLPKVLLALVCDVCCASGCEGLN